MRIWTVTLLLLALMLTSNFVYAECKEYKIVEHGERVEAVCIGEPQTQNEKREIVLGIVICFFSGETITPEMSSSQSDFLEFERVLSETENQPWSY